MKSYTDLEQSKKLAEILSIDTADMKEEWRDIQNLSWIFAKKKRIASYSFQKLHFFNNL